MKAKFIKLFLTIIVAVSAAVSGTLTAQQNEKPASQNKKATQEKSTSKKEMTMDKNSMMTASAFELKTNMRKLWEDHITWTRNVIFCIMDDLPGKDEAVKRLLKNQDEIGEAIKPYYGMDAGKQLADLLHTHITQAADLIQASKKGDDASFNEINKKWFANAGEISAFLSKANPNWKLEDMKTMMTDHLKLTTDEVVARKKKDFDGDVIAYEQVHEEILKMSDMLSDGIVKQFPDKFKGKELMGMNK